MRFSRTINWLKGARRDFEKFPLDAELISRGALTVAAEGVNPIAESRSKALKAAFSRSRCRIAAKPIT